MTGGEASVSIPPPPDQQPAATSLPTGTGPEAGTLPPESAAPSVPAETVQTPQPPPTVAELQPSLPDRCDKFSDLELCKRLAITAL